MLAAGEVVSYFGRASQWALMYANTATIRKVLNADSYDFQVNQMQNRKDGRKTRFSCFIFPHNEKSQKSS